MASRQLRKLRQQQDLLKLQTAAEEAHESSEDEPQPSVIQRKNVFSAFAALGDDGGDNDSNDDEQQSDQDEPRPATSLNAGADGQGHDAAAPKKSKKSKKKKKKGKKPDIAPATAEDSRQSLDDIDRALQELKLVDSKKEASTTAQSTTTTAVDQLRGLLRINFHHLKAMNEMRKLFGKTIETAESESTSQAARQRARAQDVNLETFLSATSAGPPGRAPQPVMFSTVLRSNPFIEGKKTWPKGSTLGLKMIPVPHDGKDVEEYAFVHDQQYDELESKFFRLVQMYDPMQLVYCLQRYPYHISSLIQVSKYAKTQDQNPVLAADLIERALFTFGRASLKGFRDRLEQGRVFMDFARPENRQFYLAGWNLIQYLVSKGTVRTALEWSKLFLSLNHEDPYAMINWIHILAIRAHEARWFVDLCGSKVLDETRGLPISSYIKQTLPLAYLQLGDLPLAKVALIEGMERLPWLYCSLFSALNLDAPKSIWGVQPRDDDEALHTKLYIHMAKDLWSNPQVISLLLDAGNAAQRVEADSLPPGPRVSLSTARFIYLDNKPELMSAVPRKMLHASPNYEFDPLPPPKEQNIFSSPGQELPWKPSTSANDLYLPPFLNDPRVRAAFRRRDAGAVGDDGGDEGDDDWNEEQQRHVEEVFRTEVEAVQNGTTPIDANRGFLGRILNLMMGDASGLPAMDFDYGDRMDMPGSWGDDNEWEEDEFEGEDDFEGADDDDDDDELPDLESVPDTESPSSAGAPQASRRATVEDAEEEEDELEQATQRR